MRTALVVNGEGGIVVGDNQVVPARARVRGSIVINGAWVAGTGPEPQANVGTAAPWSGCHPSF